MQAFAPPSGSRLEVCGRAYALRRVTIRQRNHAFELVDLFDGFNGDRETHAESVRPAACATTNEHECPYLTKLARGLSLNGGLRIGIHEKLSGFSRRRTVGLHDEFLEPRNGAVLREGLDHLWTGPRLQSVKTCGL